MGWGCNLRIVVGKVGLGHGPQAGRLNEKSETAPVTTLAYAKPAAIAPAAAPVRLTSRDIEQALGLKLAGWVGAVSWACGKSRVAGRSRSVAFCRIGLGAHGEVGSIRAGARR